MLTPVQIAFALLLLAAAIGAFVRGGTVERRGAGLFALGMAGVVVAEAVTFDATRLAVLFAIDLAVLAGLAALAWKSPRPWPVYACGFQTMVLATHVAGWIDLDMDVRLHAGMLTGFGLAALATLAIGAWTRPKPR